MDDWLFSDQPLVRRQMVWTRGDGALDIGWRHDVRVAVQPAHSNALRPARPLLMVNGYLISSGCRPRERHLCNIAAFDQVVGLLFLYAPSSRSNIFHRQGRESIWQECVDIHLLSLVYDFVSS